MVAGECYLAYYAWLVETGQISTGFQDTGLYGGDGPADVLGPALDEIARLYLDAWGRWPTMAELQACFNFVTNPFVDESNYYIPPG